MPCEPQRVKQLNAIIKHFLTAVTVTKNITFHVSSTWRIKFHENWTTLLQLSVSTSLHQWGHTIHSICIDRFTAVNELMVNLQFVNYSKKRYINQYRSVQTFWQSTAVMHNKQLRTCRQSGNYTVSQKKQATLIFTITSPSVEIFLQFLKHFVQE